MSKIKCIIVEDEPLAVKVLADYVSQVPFLELKGSFKDAILATEFLREHTVDLIFFGYPFAEIERHGVPENSCRSASGDHHDCLSPVCC